MIKKIINFLSGRLMTYIGIIFIVLSLILRLMDIKLLIDPAWYNIIINGIPMLYLAISRIFINKGISKISSALLISIGMISAVIIKDYFAAGEVAFIMAIGGLLEDMTIEKSKKGIRELVELKPPTCRLITNNEEKIIKSSEIKLDNILRVLPGEVIPIDGIIIKGNTSIDQSIITGESLPIEKSVDDEVFCGTINRFGTIDIKATKTSENSTLQQLIYLVENAENNQAPMQRLADKYASIMVPIVLIFAFLVYLFKPTNSVIAAVTILVVFCPCAFILATPTAIMAAIGQATKHGVIIKSGLALENMEKVNIIAFDKTGTLSYGKPKVSDVFSIDPNIDEKKLLILSASAEKMSEHPLAKAIVECANTKKYELLKPSNFEMSAGFGIRAIINSDDIICGNEKYFNNHNINLNDKLLLKADELREQGKISVFISINNNSVGIISLSDTIREDAPEMIEQLNKTKTETLLLTGDNEKTAKYFAKGAKINDIYANLSPKDKVEKIEKLRNSGNYICMIGDGVNDAAALKSATVGVSMGNTGSDITIESSDIVLMGDDISKISYLKKLSIQTIKTIKTGITISLSINFIAIILSLLDILKPWSAAIVHNAGSIFVVLFAAMLYDKKIK